MNTIRRGDKGEAVRTWQGVLIASGAAVESDGDFGPATEAATVLWQRSRGLTADGVVGPRTWEAAGVPSTDDVPLLRGCDTSALQGPMDSSVWRALRGVGVRFVYLRYAIGNEHRVDGRARTNSFLARDEGIVPGPYLFAFPLPKIDPRWQAEQWVRQLEGFGSNDGELAPAFDLEWPAPFKRDASGTLVDEWAKWGCSPAQIRDWADACLERGEELTGRSWTRYSYPWFLRSIEAEKTSRFKDGRLWLADYTHSGRWPTLANLDAVKVPKGFAQVDILQHDGNGGMRLPNGVDADFNVLRGGEEALAALARVSSPVPPVVVEDPALYLTEAKAVANRMIVEDAIAAYRRDRMVDL